MDCTRREAERRDAADELASFREQFYLPEGQIYLDGNSLGLLCRPAEAALRQALDTWKTAAIDGWFTGEPSWFMLAESLAEQVAPLVGASPDEVIVANSTTVNLHQLLATLYHPVDRRTKIVADVLAFPSDVHALTSHLRLRGLDSAEQLVKVPSADGLTLDEEEIAAALTDEVAVAVLPAVIYTSGQRLDMAALAEAARRRGVLIGFDCSHSFAAVPHALDAWGVDFAFWCHYKYANGGPGGAGGLYLNRRHFGRPPGLAGWFGSAKAVQMEMSHTFHPAEGAGMLQIGTPPILALAPLQGALELIHAAGIERIRRKSLALTAWLIELADRELGPLGVRTGTPREERRRGGHVALLHRAAEPLARRLAEAGVVVDYRPPGLLRLAPTALYSTFTECWEAVQRMKQALTLPAAGEGCPAALAPPP